MPASTPLLRSSDRLGAVAAVVGDGRGLRADLGERGVRRGLSLVDLGLHRGVRLAPARQYPAVMSRSSASGRAALTTRALRFASVLHALEGRVVAPPRSTIWITPRIKRGERRHRDDRDEPPAYCASCSATAVTRCVPAGWRRRPGTGGRPPTRAGVTGTGRPLCSGRRGRQRLPRWARPDLGRRPAVRRSARPPSPFDGDPEGGGAPFPLVIDRLRTALAPRSFKRHLDLHRAANDGAAHHRHVPLPFPQQRSLLHGPTGRPRPLFQLASQNG